jgi:hypothetical protein
MIVSIHCQVHKAMSLLICLLVLLKSFFCNASKTDIDYS